jgi:hypothetical protein
MEDPINAIIAAALITSGQVNITPDNPDAMRDLVSVTEKVRLALYPPQKPKGPSFGTANIDT